MKRKSVFVAWITGVCLVAVFSACSDKHKIPSGVLDREEMEVVMWDMIQADRYATMFFPSDSSKRKDIKTETFRLYEQVFQVHKITREEFVKSYKFYLSRPDISKVMFDSISSRANRRRDEEYSRPKKDSISKMVEDSASKLNLDSAGKFKLDSTLRFKADSVARIKSDSIAKVNAAAAAKLRKENGRKLNPNALMRQKADSIRRARGKLPRKPPPVRKAPTLQTDVPVPSKTP